MASWDDFADQRIALEALGYVYNGPVLESSETRDIFIARDLWNDDDPAKVPLLTSVTSFTGPVGKGTKNTDRKIYADFEFKEEAKYFKRPHHPFSETVHVRSHGEVDRHFSEMMAAVERCGKPLVAVGFDTEGKDATAQFALVIDDCFAKGKTFKKHVVVQLRSSKKGCCVCDDGVPGKLIEFMQLKSLVFVGKDIMKDVEDMMKGLGLSVDDCQSLKYIELDQLFDTAYNYAMGPHSLLRWLNEMQEYDVNPLGKLSLKHLYAFGRPGWMLGKNERFRDDRSNWMEKRGSLRKEDIEYAIMDAEAGRVTLNGICALLGLRWEHFVRVVGLDPRTFFCPAILSIAEAYAGKRDPNGLGKIEEYEYGELLINVDRVQEAVEVLTTTVRRWRLKGELARLCLKYLRVGTKHVVAFKEVSSCCFVKSRSFGTAGAAVTDVATTSDTTPTAEPVLPVELPAVNSASIVAGVPMDVDLPDVDAASVFVGAPKEVTVPEVEKNADKGEVDTVVEEYLNELLGQIEDDGLVSEVEQSICAGESSNAIQLDDSSSISLESTSLPPPPPLNTLPLPSLPSTSSTPSSLPLPSLRTPNRPSSPIRAPTRRRCTTGVAASRGLQAPVMRIVEHHVDAVVDTLMKDKRTYIRAVIRRLSADVYTETADNCVRAIRKLRDRRCSSAEMSLIVREMKLLFHGESLHHFALRVISEDPFGYGRLAAASKVRYFAISSFILVDAIFAERRDGDALKFMVRQFRKVKIMEVVDCVAMHFRDRGAVLNIMRGKECFVGYDVVDPDAKWTVRRIRKFIVEVCNVAQISPPPAAKIVFLYDALMPTVDAFLRGETEEDDFFQLCNNIAADDPSHFERCVDYVATRCPSLAAYLATRGGLVSRPLPAGAVEFVPACAQPYNVALHELPLVDDLVLKDASDLRGFAANLRKSHYIAAEFHTTNIGDGSSRYDCITLCLRSRIYHLALRIFPDVLSPLINLLKEMPRTLFVLYWDQHKERCRVELGWEPTEVTDAADVAREVGIEPTLDNLAEKVVGGKFCRRASNFTDVSLPSEVALQHRGIRATLIYEFVVQTKRLRQHREGSGRSRAHGSRHERGQPRDKSGRRHDQQLLSPDERNRHFATGREREGARAGRRDGDVRDRSRH